MGTMNAANPVHLDNGITYRAEKSKLDILLHKNAKFCTTGSSIKRKKALKANDLLLAKLAILQSVVLTNDLSLSDKNSVINDFYTSVWNIDRFCRFFDYLMKQQRGY